MEDYRKFKWFYTSSGKLVVGGKSAAQNDELMKRVKQSGDNRVVMHTSDPGSPFSVIVSDVKKVTQNDLEECAVFTGCFSRAWKEGKKSTQVDMFYSDQVEKRKGMKTGTWGVNGKVKKFKVTLELVLTRQDDVLRAVPEKSVKKKHILLKIAPGKIDKRQMIVKLSMELGDDNINEQELIAALPAGGIRIIK